MSHLALARLVLATELRGLLRDRRALLLGVVLPTLLIPLMFAGMSALERTSNESAAQLRLQVAVDVEALDTEVAHALLGALSAPDKRLEVELANRALEPFDANDEEAWRRTAQRELARGERAAIVAIDGAVEPACARVVYDASSRLGNEAHKRVRTALEDFARERNLLGVRELLRSDPGARFRVEPHDVASAEDSAGQALARMLPLILVLILITGGSFAALGAFAAEREQGTIETLLVQPVSGASVATGKFLAVFVTASVTAVLNAASFLVCTAVGLGEGPAWIEAPNAPAVVASTVGRMLLGLLLFLPTSAFLSAVLCLISARARSFREGQHYVLPTVLVASILAAVSTQDRVPTGALLAMVPVTGPTMVLRDTLTGAFAPGLALVAVSASLVWSALVLTQLATTVDAERLFKTRETPAEAAARKSESRRALRWGWASVILVYVVGGRLQTESLGLGPRRYAVDPRPAPGLRDRAARGAPRGLGRRHGTRSTACGGPPRGAPARPGALRRAARVPRMAG